ncbi:MAG: D-2-hydroxyacid dehydrogenase [bacterium]|nr:D-2-hydroxyacid dehydrogenase [bacterium]MDE0600232.1 D-2-hydroxyacid dehydrogenase [bacterium]
MSGTHRVVLHPCHPWGVRDSLARVPGVEVISPPDLEGLTESLEDPRSEILVSFIWTDECLSLGLRWIQSISSGCDSYPWETLAEAGIRLTSGRGANAPAVAEHAFALLLAMTRRVGKSVRYGDRGIWRQAMCHELSGSTLGILGMGAVGEEIAWRAKAWGMEVIGTKRHPDSYEGVASEVYGPEGTLEVFRRADAVINALPFGRGAPPQVGAAELEALGDGWFVNVGRGSTVDTGSLLEALDSGELRGAGLDVTYPEPPPEDSPLWTHHKVVLTPHLGGFSPQYADRLAEIFAVNLQAFRGEGEWVNVVV